MRCFPALKLNEQQFIRLSGIQDGTLFETDGGFALVKGNNIRLLCVLPEKQGQGIGGALLAQAEDFIRSNGCDRAEIGGTGSGLFIGAVRESVGFFEKRGYTFGEEIAEMYGNSGELRLDVKQPDGVEFRYEPGGSERLKHAVSAVDEDWVQYFSDGEIFCAYCGGEIAAFCIVEDDVDCIFSDGTVRVGSVGCVGTVPKFRRQGIGLTMVARASQQLIRSGCGRIFIHYTAVYDWYAKLGYKTGLWVRLGGKELN